MAQGEETSMSTQLLETPAMLSQHATDLLISLMYADRVGSQASGSKKRLSFRGGRQFFEDFGQLAGIGSRTIMKRARLELQVSCALLADRHRTHKHYQLANDPWTLFKQYNGLMTSPILATRTYTTDEFEQLLKISGDFSENFPLEAAGTVLIKAAIFGSNQPLIYAVSQAAYDRLLKAELTLKIANSKHRVDDSRAVIIQTWSVDPATVSRRLHGGISTPQADPIHLYLSLLTTGSIKAQTEAAQLVETILH